MLKSGDKHQLAKLIQQQKAEVRNIITNCISLVYFMRGAVQYEDMLMRTFAERRLMSDFIENRLEIESKSMSPNY